MQYCIVYGLLKVDRALVYSNQSTSDLLCGDVECTEYYRLTGRYCPVYVVLYEYSTVVYSVHCNTGVQCSSVQLTYNCSSKVQ